MIHRLAIQHRLPLYLLHKGGINFPGDVLNSAVFHRSIKTARQNIFKNIQLFDIGQDFRRRFGGDLAAVGAVNLVAVVLAGVMGCGDHDSGRAAQIPGCKGDRGHRHQCGPDVNPYPIGRENRRCRLCKHIAFDAAVVANDNRGSRELLFQVVRQTLGCFCHGIDVHPVGSGTDNAPKASRTEGQIPVESILHSGPVHLPQLPGHVLICAGTGQPAFVFLLNIRSLFHSLILLHPKTGPGHGFSWAQNPRGQKYSRPYKRRFHPLQTE